jgi:hypothetical protein
MMVFFMYPHVVCLRLLGGMYVGSLSLLVFRLPVAVEVVVVAGGAEHETQNPQFGP